MLHLTEAMGSKRGNGRGSFIASTIDLVDCVYAEVMQGIRAWTPPAPCMPNPEQADTDTTAMSSQDGSDTKETTAAHTT